MTFASLKFWPRTLGAQLIVVTALAVAVSNAGVAVWFAATRESENAERPRPSGAWTAPFPSPPS